MGIIQSHHHANIFYEHSRQINQEQFNVIPNYSYTHHVDPYYGSNYCLLVHKQKFTFQVQKYQLFFNTYQEYRNYFQNFEWRNKSKYLVQAKNLRERVNGSMCATFHQATIFIQRVPIRACEITDIPIQEGLYLLYCCVQGFRKIYQKTGYFEITLDMICINKQAMVKVWLNNNLSKISPEFYSINHNFTQADFLYKLLYLCQPLIDFTTIKQNFSDFLKSCCFTCQKAPKKEVDDKFCRYSRLKELNITKIHKVQLQQNSHLLTFDKIIQFFEGYLNKHKLVVARQMKSIRDLFRVQTKIYCKEQLNIGKKKDKTDFEVQQDQKPKQQNLQICFDNTNKKKTTIQRKNTKRTNEKLMTQRSAAQQPHQPSFMYKSQQLPKNITEAKWPQIIAKRRPPSISFEYKPVISPRNQIQNVYSPQHISQSKQPFFQTRDRIKTTITPNITFTVRPRKNQPSSKLSPDQRQKSITTCCMKIEKRENQIQVKQLIKNLQKTTTQRNSQLDQQKGANDVQKNGMFKKNLGISKKKTIYYALQKELQIDQQIADDLDLLSQNAQKNLQQIR